MTTVHVAKDFSRYPAGRVFADGPYNGQLFRQRFLESAIRAQKSLTIELDGVRGYGSSFLEEAFGGLVRSTGLEPASVLNLLELRSSNKSLIQEIREYIENANSGEND